MKEIKFCKITNVENILKNPKKEFHEVDNPVKAYKLTVNTGTEERTVVSAITQFYTPEMLINTITTFQTDLPPAMIRGFESQAMIYLIELDSAPVMIIGKEEELGQSLNEIEFFAKKLVGWDKEMVVACLNANNIDYRIVREDAMFYIVTADLRLDRLSLELDNDIVTKIEIG